MPTPVNMCRNTENPSNLKDFFSVKMSYLERVHCKSCVKEFSDEERTIHQIYTYFICISFHDKWIQLNKMQNYDIIITNLHMYFLIHLQAFRSPTHAHI